MNRLINYTQNQSLTATYYSEPVLDFLKTGNRTIDIEKKILDSGQELLIIPFTNRDGIIFPVKYDQWEIDLDYVGLSSVNNIGGLVDGLALAASTTYNIWAFADQYGDPKGIGIAKHLYDASVTCPAVVKGSEGTFTGVEKAYRFTVGAKARVIRDTTIGAEIWNLGTISEIVSSTSLKITMDNGTYGDNITSGTGSIEQLNRIHCYTPDDSNQSDLYNYYRIIGRFETDSSSNIIDTDYTYPKVDMMPIKSIVGIDLDWIDTISIDEPWYACTGQEIKTYKSPYIGQATNDLYKRFLRMIDSGGTTGTNQAATEHIHNFSNNTGGGLWYWPQTSTAILNPDTVTNDGAGVFNRTIAATGLSGSIINRYYTSRPINTSTIWIIKVK